MRLYERDRSPYWWYEFTVGGETSRKSTGRLIADKASAYKVMVDAYNVTQNEAQFGALPDITLDEACRLTLGTVDGATLKSYGWSHRRLCGLGSFSGDAYWSLDGDMLMTGMKQSHITTQKAERRGEGLKPNSINIEIRFMQRVYNLAKEEYAVAPNLKFKQLKKFEKTRYLSPDELEDVFGKLNNNPLSQGSYEKASDLMMFLVDTGARLQEGLGITWRDVNFDTNRIEVFRTKTKSVSKLPMTPRVRAMLERKQNTKRPFEAMTRSVTLLRNALHETCNTDERVVTQRGAATIHSLRDTFASRLADKGMTLHEIAKLLGHSSTSMTRKYAHLESGSVVDRAMALLEG